MFVSRKILQSLLNSKNIRPASNYNCCRFAFCLVLFLLTFIFISISQVRLSLLISHSRPKGRLSVTCPAIRDHDLWQAVGHVEGKKRITKASLRESRLTGRCSPCSFVGTTPMTETISEEKMYNWDHNENLAACACTVEHMHRLSRILPGEGTAQRAQAGCHLLLLLRPEEPGSFRTAARNPQMHPLKSTTRYWSPSKVVDSARRKEPVTSKPVPQREAKGIPGGQLWVGREPLLTRWA